MSNPAQFPDNMPGNLSSCYSVVWKIGPYVDGELPLVECEEVEAHLLKCPDCDRTAKEFRRLDRLAQAKVPPVSGEEWSELWSEIETRTRKGDVDTKITDTKIIEMPERTGFLGKAARASPPGVQRWTVPALAAAACLLFGAFVGYSLAPPSAPKTPVTHGTEGNFAEHLSGPKPEIEDSEENTTSLKYSEKDF